VRQVDYLPELYEDARSEKIKDATHNNSQKLLRPRLHTCFSNLLYIHNFETQIIIKKSRSYIASLNVHPIDPAQTTVLLSPSLF
jgi:hypothetical protein